MGKVTQASKRKSEHITINLERDVASGITTGFERYRFIHEALPDLNLADLSTESALFGRTLAAPILISSMTGGTDDAERINANLAEAAQSTRIAMGVGSQRVAIEDPSHKKSFQIRNRAPDILLFANLGAIQLNYGFDPESCQRAVEMIEADALILHLNALQEALQPEGETRFKGLLGKIKAVCSKLDVPVVAKEVGWGISSATAKRLVDVGVAAIDVAGAGGTSWSQVEMYRAESEARASMAAEFINWGIPTAEAIVALRQSLATTPLIASGGLRNGLDIAKAIALGANLVGMASPFLKAAVESAEAVVDQINWYSDTLRITLFATGCESLNGLTDVIERIE